MPHTPHTNSEFVYEVCGILDIPEYLLLIESWCEVQLWRCTLNSKLLGEFVCGVCSISDTPIYFHRVNVRNYFKAFLAVS